MNLRSPGIQVQVIGILVSIMGAVLAEFFKGPLVRPSSHHLRHTDKQYLVFSSTPEFWVLGGALLAASFFSLSIFNLFQVRVTPFLFLNPFSYSFSILQIKFSFWIMNESWWWFEFVLYFHPDRKKPSSDIRNQWKCFLILTYLEPSLVQ